MSTQGNRSALASRLSTFYFQLIMKLRPKIRRILNYVFLRVSSGDLILFVGTPSGIPLNFFKMQVAGSGNLLAHSSYQSTTLLTQGGSKTRNSRLPDILIVFRAQEHENVLRYAKANGVLTIGFLEKPIKINPDFCVYIGRSKQSILWNSIFNILLVCSLGRLRSISQH